MSDAEPAGFSGSAHRAPRRPPASAELLVSAARPIGDVWLLVDSGTAAGDESCRTATNAHRMRIRGIAMPAHNGAARKRPVNLTLNEDLVAQARAVTGNLSAVVESLLADYIIQERQRRAAEADVVRETVATWNRFAEKVGSFADDHSTL